MRPGPRRAKSGLCWNANAVCHTGIATADLHGYFGRHNLKVERINFSGASDQLLELLASGKADAGVGMALGWLKPLEQGFDVKLTAALHGGCIRVLTNQQSGITSIAGLKGKAVGTFNMASPDRNFVSILAARNGFDPLKDIDWRIYPADLLERRIAEGRDPGVLMWRSDRVDCPRPRPSGRGDEQSRRRFRQSCLLRIGNPRWPGS